MESISSKSFDGKNKKIPKKKALENLLWKILQDVSRLKCTQTSLPKDLMPSKKIISIKHIP